MDTSNLPSAPDFNAAAAIAAVADNKNSLHGRYDAAYAFEYIKERLEEFQKGLSDDEELGLQLANFGVASEIHIRGIGYRNPNLIVFVGLDADGNEVTLIQHLSQLNLLLIAIKPIEEKAHRLGF